MCTFLSLTTRSLFTIAAKVTPSLLQFNEGFKGFKIGSACEENGAPVISGLKGILMGQNAGSERGKGWVDGVTLMCYDRPDGPDQKSKRFPVEELVGFIIGYLKDCAEDYLTRKPIKRINQIDGSVVETTATYRPVDDTAENTDTTGTGEGKTDSQKGDTAPPAAAAAQKPAQRVEITRVVLGIPANFTEQSKRCLKSAAHLAGFQEVRPKPCAYQVPAASLPHMQRPNLGGYARLHNRPSMCCLRKHMYD
jgi:hypothetical protein